MESSNKKAIRNLSESDTENEAADFSRITVIESLEDLPGQIFHFLYKKRLLRRELALPKVKKTQNGNLLVEVDSRRQAENILIMKSFHTTKCRTYPYERQNASMRVISRGLALAEEMTAALGK